MSTGTPMVVHDDIPFLGVRDGSAKRLFSKVARRSKLDGIKDILAAVTLMRSAANKAIQEDGSRAFVEMRLFEVCEYSLMSISELIYKGTHTKKFRELCRAALAGMKDVATEAAGRQANYRKNIESFGRSK